MEAHEKRINRSTDQSLEQAFQTKLDSKEKEDKQKGGQFQKSQNGRNKNFGRRNSNKGGNSFNNQQQGSSLNHQEGSNSSNNQQGSSNSNNQNGRSSIQCYVCNKYGHKSADCRYKCTRCRIPNHSQRDCRYQKNNEANFTENNDSQEQLFYTCFSSHKDSQDVWYVDSGCSNHMTGNKQCFVKLEEKVNSQVKLGDGKLHNVEGKGIISVQTKGGIPKLVYDVLYVPNLAQNLLSVGQLLQRGFLVKFEDDYCVISDKKNNTLVAKIKMTANKVFPLLMTSKENLALEAEKVDGSLLWHLRYGHLNQRSLQLLHQKSMVVGLPSIHSEKEICEGCIFGKFHRLPFSQSSWRAKAPLELVHADICGPTRTPSFNNKRYFILFVDDFSRMMWVYFLEQKSEAFSVFKQFKAFGENQSGHNLKVLRTDRGGEFTSNEFSEYCKSNGIKRELTARYTPQQNGVAERRNRTIVEMARSMLKAKSLPNTFWAEAIHTSVFILNRSPTKAVKDKTPFEAWHRFKPKVDFFKIFGCTAYAHIPSQKREKFDEKGEKYIFVGYSDQSKAYRLIDPRTKSLVISRDVIFDELKAWKWENYDIEVPRFFEEPDSSHSEETQFLQSPIPSARTSDPSSPDSTPRLNARTRSLADIYESCDLALSALEPQKFEEAVKENIWQDAMDEEIRVIKKNRTWELVDRPKSKDIIGLKWVYKIKFNGDGSIQNHKVRLVAKGYSQQPGIDFNETFAPVVRMETIRTVLALAAQLKTKVYQLDVKSAFLNGELEEEVYVEQPQGYVEKGREDKVYRLRKALYGLKQAPRAWNNKIDHYFQQNGFTRSLSEPSLYLKKEGTHDSLILCLYVDDLIYTSTNPRMAEVFKKNMMKEYEMTDLGTMRYFLGIQVQQSDEGIFISQGKYAENLLKKFNMLKSKPMDTPMAINLKLTSNDGAPKFDASIYKSVVGSLIYLTNTRPDIVHAVSVVSRFMSDPSNHHFAAVKRILRYIQGTKGYGIRYTQEKKAHLVGYTDSDWAGAIDDRKSTSGHVFFLGSKVISWSSKKQSTVALSTTEAEYISATSTACEAVWIRRILADLRQEQNTPTKLYCDNMSTIAMTKNPVFHSRSKHIELRHHFIRKLVEDGEIELKFCGTDEQIADVFTKALPREKFYYFRERLNVAGQMH